MARSNNKRKTLPTANGVEGSVKRRFVEADVPSERVAEDEEAEAEAEAEGQAEEEAEEEAEAPADDSPADAESSKPEDEAEHAEDSKKVKDNDDSEAEAKRLERLQRFKTLQARQTASRKQNLKESQLETQRLATDPALLASLGRQHAVASHKLLKAETEAAGDDFERKRAWDWTVDEAEKWDRRMEKKDKHRRDVAFQDYTQEARKTYKRQMRDFKPDLDAYDKQKMDAVRKAAAQGGLDIVETDDGELIAIDRDGTFYSTADSVSFAQNKPDKAAIDRLVDDLKKAEEARLKKRRERRKDQDDGGDVTYINLKNKQFNDKLKRFYDKYTSDIRESFERGTAV